MAGLNRLVRVVAFSMMASVFAPALMAQSDAFVARVNDRYKNIQKDKRSDLVILPVLSVMDAPPLSVSDPIPAVLILPTSPNWKAASDWATAKPQKDVLEALKKVTSEDDYRKSWAFGQPYGASAVESKYVDMGLYTELGESGYLASADFKYLAAVKKLEILAHIEATRLVHEHKGNDALELMRQWAYFAHQIADRQFLKEKRVGMEMLILAYQRMRDLAYLDGRSDKPGMTAEGIRDTLNKLYEGRSPAGVELISLPSADKDAGDQLVNQTFVPGAGPHPERFASVYARVAAGDRPLRRFSESAKWDGIRPLHAKTDDIKRIIGNIFGDWAKRWELPTGEPLLELPTDFNRLDRVQAAAADMVLGDFDVLFPLRQQLRAEAVGTRGALAVQGFKLLHGNFPSSLEAPAPQILSKGTKVLIDPMDKANKTGTAKYLGYFRPAKDTPGVHTVRVFPKVTGITYDNFELPLNEDYFVVYASGPDGNQNGMKLATQMVKDDKGDYLIWPPMLSLLRQNLSETNKLP